MHPVLTPRVQITLLLTITLLAGCGEVVVFGHTVREGHAKTEVKTESAPVPVAATNTASTSSTASATTKAPTRPAIQVKAITISIAPQAAEKIAKDSRFSTNALRDAIRSELKSRKLLDVSDSATGSTMEIFIDNYELHPTTNFAIFGYVPNAGTLTAKLVLNDEQGTPRHIEAHAKVSVPAAGEVDNMLQPLYREFAVTVVDTLTGTQPRSGTDN
jgi:hypothetical protein